jgi:hypothetical protein
MMNLQIVRIYIHDSTNCSCYTIYKLFSRLLDDLGIDQSWLLNGIDSRVYIPKVIHMLSQLKMSLCS